MQGKFVHNMNSLHRCTFVRRLCKLSNQINNGMHGRILCLDFWLLILISQILKYSSWSTLSLIIQHQHMMFKFQCTNSTF